MSKKFWLGLCVVGFLSAMFSFPLGWMWAVETWAKSGGYQGADDRERIWFSPGCIGAEAPAEQLSMWSTI